MARPGNAETGFLLPAGNRTAKMSTGGEVANAAACKAVIHGFKSHPVLQSFADAPNGRIANNCDRTRGTIVVPSGSILDWSDTVLDEKSSLLRPCLRPKDLTSGVTEVSWPRGLKAAPRVPRRLRLSALSSESSRRPLARLRAAPLFFHVRVSTLGTVPQRELRRPVSWPAVSRRAQPSFRWWSFPARLYVRPPSTGAASPAHPQVDQSRHRGSAPHRPGYWSSRRR